MFVIDGNLTTYLGNTSCVRKCKMNLIIGAGACKCAYGLKNHLTILISFCIIIIYKPFFHFWDCEDNMSDIYT